MKKYELKNLYSIFSFAIPETSYKLYLDWTNITLCFYVQGRLLQKEGSGKGLKEGTLFIGIVVRGVKTGSKS